MSTGKYEVSIKETEHGFKWISVLIIKRFRFVFLQIVYLIINNCCTQMPN